MEVLTVFFEAIDNILIGYTKRGKCELPEFLDKILKREDISSILSKVRDSKEISQEAIQEAINNFTDLISPDEIPEGLMKLWEEEKTPLGHMVPDVSLDIEFQCVELLRNKLFSLIRLTTSESSISVTSVSSIAVITSPTISPAFFPEPPS